MAYVFGNAMMNIDEPFRGSILLRKGSFAIV